MQLADGETANRIPDLRETTDRIRTLRFEIDETRRLGEEQEKAFRLGRASSEQDFRNDEERREKALRRDLESLTARTGEERRRLADSGTSRRERIERAASSLRRRLTVKLDEERKRTDAAVRSNQRALDVEDSRITAPLEQRHKRWEELRLEVAEHHRRTEEALARFAARHGASRGSAEEWLGNVDADADPDALAGEVHGGFDEVLARLSRTSGWFSASLARTGFLVVCQCLLLLLGGAAAVVSLRLGAQPGELVPVFAGVLVLTILLHAASAAYRRRFRRTTRELEQTVSQQAERFMQHAGTARAELEAALLKRGEEHVAKQQSAERRERDASRVRVAAELRQLEWLEGRKEGAEARLAARTRDLNRASEAEEERERTALKDAYESECERRSKDHREHLARLAEEYETATGELRERRRSAMATFKEYATAVRATMDRESGSWDAVPADRFEPMDEFPDFVPLGRLRIALGANDEIAEATDAAEEEFDLPVAASYPGHGSLLIEHAPGERDAALGILMNTILRTLTAFPPGKVRMTILDPVGLGQSFSALMHLADHDEALVTSRIWTDTSQIEARLAELSEHIEKVIQKYLRNRYGTIGEYNAEAGDLQEPYHFLVIADFPTAFNDLAAERLASIISSGPRCGVYTLIAHDTRQVAPPPLDLELMRRNGPAILLSKSGASLFGKHLESGEFLPEKLPAPDFTNSLLDRVGKLSVDASTVELSFDAVTPTGDEVWSESTAKGIRVPIGRTGAERLQYLDLGRGTAQHALVAGRTGSGKSTLFHVMVTNMALWFGPEELQFYLVDFKKGVEFKVFATHALPHARVVAIESDREFGLSVLRAVDAELSRRGDIFRRLGVQDLSGYRRHNGAEVLPRTLLLIDEFQEFFTDDDAVAHDAAVLLDRFVRQGRAFGIHVVLGSQTLSGIYTLARGTLGQMGVRIALQCNESDSYLILSEDNGVARLLTRPGKAIYNDKSGLLAGNNPFQVVWLPDTEQEEHLRLVAERARDLPPGTFGPAMVFEGNQPAEIMENDELLALAGGERTASGAVDRAWIGEPNAIKGPTEVRFSAASGSNLLIVGQRREAAFAMMASSVLSLAAGRPTDDLRIVILDGGGYETEFANRFDDLLASVPHLVERYDLRTTPEAVAEVAELVERRAEDTDDDSPVYVIAFGLQRLRMLRREDDFGMSFGEDAGESSGEQFGTILTDGPPRRVHTIIWCDTVPNLQRTLSRKAMREFDVRVVFQMSAADSSELIESSAANRLGLHSALLAVESQGTFEKFRPYAIPSAETMRKLGGGR